MVSLQCMPRLVNFGLQTPEIHATQNSLKNDTCEYIACDFRLLDASTTTPEPLNLNPVAP